MLRNSVDTSFSLQDSQNYGIDHSGPLPDEDLVTVIVPETVSPLGGQQLMQFLSCIDTHTVFDDYGIAHFVDAKRTLQSVLQLT